MPTAPATTRAGESRLARVGLVVELLHRGWHSGQQIMNYVEMASERAGQRTTYNNVQGATRNARLRTLTDGRCWQYMDVNQDMTGGGFAFRLWTITEEMVPRAHPAWQFGNAEVVILKQGPPDKNGNPTVIEKVFRRQHVDNLGDGRAASREVPAPPARRRPPRSCDSGSATRPVGDEVQGRLL